jgi:AbrB family looped-hinge helix DNA binding protein
MPTATLSSNCQLVIPKPVREQLHLHPGDTLDFLVQKNGDVWIRPATQDVRELKGALRRQGQPPVSLAAMQEAIRRRGGRRP